MATLLESICVSRPTLRHRHSALQLADDAACACLRAAGVEPADVDLLINTGLYRDRNLGEPAFASLIQEDVGLNPEDPHAGAHGTFSFDLANGVCGPLNAVQVIDRFLRSGALGRGLVVASDADPGHHLAVDFPFEPSGAAATLVWSDDGRGFGSFHWSTSLDGGASFSAVVRPERDGNILRFEVTDDFAREGALLASKVADEALTESGLTAANLAVVVVAPGAPALVEGIADALSLATDRVVAPAPGVHTAGVLVALDQARREGRLEEGPALVLCAAAGLVAGATVYRA